MTREWYRIRPIKREDVLGMHEWELNEEIAMASGVTKPRSLEVFQTMYEKYFLKVTHALKLYSIVLDERVIGRAELGLIDRENGNAAFGIVIGEQSSWGNGYGKEAILELLDVAFHELHLHKVYCEVYTFNQRSLNMMDSLGFHRDGILREHEFFRGVYHDLVLFSMMRTEFNK
ncbi:GNAT family N-acetyltransferase [Listeria sp. FSL L7-1582]|uniref:GNAT family N-acetyltransferase n=1 Tax=Listeria portnoyi TaxID=2713504 RepID=UPI00164E9D72|nr:GNAT family protein [Listeria portnoyi]MBC6308380.1 GNAT family N-acetyltransferase [Listeria portnoyi]